MKILFTIISISTLFFVIADAQDNYTLQSHNLKIKGTSTIHDWVINATKANSKASMVMTSNKVKDIKSLMFEVPVFELRSEKKSETMDQKVFEALKSKLFPNVVFNLVQLNSIHTGSNNDLIDASGTVKIGGISKEINLKVNARSNADGTIAFQGEKKLLMSDFGIAPPKAMFGTITAGDEVNVNFEIIMKKIN